MSNRIWFAELSCGAEMTCHELIEAEDYNKATEIARESCTNFATSYGYYTDMEYFGNLDEVCEESSWNEETEEYEDVSELVYFVVPYVPEEHNDYL